MNPPQIPHMMTRIFTYPSIANWCHGKETNRAGLTTPNANALPRGIAVGIFPVGLCGGRGLTFSSVRSRPIYGVIPGLYQRDTRHADCDVPQRRIRIQHRLLCRRAQSTECLLYRIVNLSRSTTVRGSRINCSKLLYGTRARRVPDSSCRIDCRHRDKSRPLDLIATCQFLSLTNLGGNSPAVEHLPGGSSTLAVVRSLNRQGIVGFRFWPIGNLAGWGASSPWEQPRCNRDDTGSSFGHDYRLD